MITKILTEEHKEILKVIENLSEQCGKLGAGEPLNKEFFIKAIEFIRKYADKFHHAKEEDILFKEFNKAEGLHCNPVEQMLYEHEQGRKFVKGIEEGLNENNKEKVIENAEAYSNLLKEHIYKEDNILYPMAEEALKKQKKEIEIKFAKADKKKEKDKKEQMAFVKSLE